MMSLLLDLKTASLQPYHKGSFSFPGEARGSDTLFYQTAPNSVESLAHIHADLDSASQVEPRGVIPVLGRTLGAGDMQNRGDPSEGAVAPSVRTQPPAHPGPYRWVLKNWGADCWDGEGFSGASIAWTCMSLLGWCNVAAHTSDAAVWRGCVQPCCWPRLSKPAALEEWPPAQPGCVWLVQCLPVWMVIRME